MKLLLTSVYHKVDNNPYSFFVLDPATKRITNNVPYSPELDSRPTDGRVDIAAAFTPFGITSGEGKIFVASNYNIAAFDKDTYEFIEIVSTSGVPHVHEITYADGYIYRTNTTNDTLTRINLATKEEIHFSFKTMAREETLTYPSDNRNVMDVVHLNAITVDGDKVYVLAHNRYQKRSEIFVMDRDLTSAEKLVNLDYAQHDILLHGGKLYSFGSQRAVLAVVDLETLKVSKRFLADPDVYFLRGGVILNGEIVVFANRKGSGTFNQPFHEPGAPMDNAKILTVNLDTYLVTGEQETDEFSTIADLIVID
jgi:DNA-binding beta-propeller fold protein YncE